MSERERDEMMVYLLNIIPKIKARIKQIKQEIYDIQHQEIYEIYQNYLDRLEKEKKDMLLQQSYRLDVEILAYESQLNNLKTGVANS